MTIEEYYTTKYERRDKERERRKRIFEEYRKGIRDELKA